MNINEINKKFDYLVNRAQAGNTSPARKNLAYDLANKIMYRKYFGLPENFLPGQPAASFSITQQIEEILMRLKKAKTLYINDDGEATIPDDFMHASTLAYLTMKNGKKKRIPITIFNDIEFLEAEDSYVVPADKDNPVGNFIGNKIRFLPVDLVNAELIYLRIPVTPVWGYTLVSNRPVYNAGTSVDPEWPDDLEIEFVVTAAQAAGVNMQRQLLFQEMSQYKNNAT